MNDIIVKATPRNRPPKIVSVARNAESWIKCMEYSHSSIGGATRSDCQAGPVSQNEVCQSKQHIQFCRLFSQTSVSGLSISESTLYYRKDMFDFCPDGCLFVFPTLDLRFGSGRLVFALRWPAVDFVFDLFPCSIPGNGVLSLLRAQVRTVTINSFLFAGQQLRRHRDIMGVGSGHLNGVRQSAVLVHTDVGLVAEVPGIPFLDRMGVRVPLFLLVFRG